MAEVTDYTLQQETEAVPAAATIQITLGNGDTDTVELNPEWAAMLFKRMRANGGTSDISIYGLVPDGSPEAHARNQHIIIPKGHITPADWKNWLTTPIL